jgi:DNA processing protein
MGKKIYVLPHRIGESEGTNKLIEDGLAQPIYNIDNFLDTLGIKQSNTNYKDEILNFCQNNSSYDDAVVKYGSKIFEYELLGKIKVENGQIII